MSLTKEKYSAYVAILKEELVLALGCTEPIAIAYGAAKAREVLGEMPDKIIVSCSGNIIKNVKGVVVPTTKNLRGMEAAALIGVVGGKSEKNLEVLSEVTEADLAKTKELISSGICQTKILTTPAKLHIIIEMSKGENSSMVEIIHSHLGLVKVMKNGEAILDVPHSMEDLGSGGTDRSCLNVADIIEFANAVNIADVEEVLSQQVKYNSDIASEGLNNKYGANVGATLIGLYGNSDIKNLAKATAAAGSDARMGGCEKPVVINSGSGNQGITVSIPVIEYAKHLSSTNEQLYRALCVSNLTAIHQKTKIGKLSAYCGAVSAATGAGAGIAYLNGGSYEDISKTIINTLANVSGIVCDGAKSSCAAKIASSVDAALLGYYMALEDREFLSGEGLVKGDVESTIASIGRLAKDGMQVTDEEILRIMVEC